MTIHNPTTGMRVVRTRSIPTEATERLTADLAHMHALFHTPEGLRDFDAPRRSLIDNGRKILAIRDELRRRGAALAVGCRFCGA